MSTTIGGQDQPRGDSGVDPYLAAYHIGVGERLMMVQAKQPSNDFWMVWIQVDDKPIRRAFSLDDVERLAQEFGCNRVHWHEGAYQEMVNAGVAPSTPPDWVT